MANDNLENTLIKQFGNGILPIQPEDFEEIKAAIKKDEQEERSAKYNELPDKCIQGKGYKFCLVFDKFCKECYPEFIH